MSKDNVNVPYQVEQIIKSMLNPSENIYLRGNYRARLDVIQDVINKAIKKYDQDVILFDGKGKRK
jgi:hypothetical protein